MRKVITSLLAGLVVTGGLAAGSSAAVTHHQSAAPDRTIVVTVPMTTMARSHGKFAMLDTGRTVGDCGLAQLTLHAGARTYNLTLFSSQGGMGVGSYSVYTNGFFQVPTPGGINANGSTAWTSRTQLVLDPGLAPTLGWVTGWVWTANAGPCGFAVTANWND